MTPVEERIDHEEAERIIEGIIERVLAADWICQPFGEEPGHQSMLPERLAVLTRKLLTEHSACEEALAYGFAVLNNIAHINDEQARRLAIQALLKYPDAIPDALPAMESAQPEEERPDTRLERHINDREQGNRDYAAESPPVEADPKEEP